VTSGESTYTLELPYRRSLGPVVGAFLTGLRDATVVGSRTAAGRVIVPPLEYDPDTGDEISELVPVGQAGVVTTWAWVPEPMRKHPLDRPFAWALVQLDGADVPFLHAVDAGDESKMSTGMRVKVRWAAEPVDDFAAIECFEPAPGGAV
jgi:uncharacterized OB-fold protein